MKTPPCSASLNRPLWHALPLAAFFALAVCGSSNAGQPLVVPGDMTVSGNLIVNGVFSGTGTGGGTGPIGPALVRSGLGGSLALSELWIARVSSP